jgi:hypothetical protein
MHLHNAGPNAIKLADASESASTWMRCAGSDSISSLNFGVSSTASRHWFIPLFHNIVVPSAEDWMCRRLGVNLSRSTHARLSVHVHKYSLLGAHTAPSSSTSSCCSHGRGRGRCNPFSYPAHLRLFVRIHLPCSFSTPSSIPAPSSRRPTSSKSHFVAHPHHALLWHTLYPSVSLKKEREI